MSFAEFSPSFLEDLTRCAEQSPRRRQHYNIHPDYADPVQRLFNAICVNSYIRPHRHRLDPKRECLMAVRGRLALVTFDDEGAIVDHVPFGTNASDAAGVEVEPTQWHTVVALEPGSILFEVKQGPFDPDAAKEMAPWSPAEGAPEAGAYLSMLRNSAGSRRV